MLSVSQSWKSVIRSPDLHRQRRLSGHTRPVFVIPQTSASYPNSEITTTATYTVALIPGLNNELARECMIRVPFQSFRSMLTVSKAWNSELRSPYFHRHRTVSGCTRPVFLFAHNSESYPSQKTTTRVIIFDPDNGICTKLPRGPEFPPFTPLIYSRVAGVRSKVFVFRNTAGVDDETCNLAIHVFDFSTGRWRDGNVMPGPGRMYYGLASDPVSESLLVAGGYNDKAVAMKSALLYDVASDTWKGLADMENERYLCEAMFHGGRFHVINGFGLSQTRCLAAESLDHDTWQWSRHPEGEFVDPRSGRTQMVRENGEGDVYRFSITRGWKVDVRRGGEWQAEMELPVETGSRVDLVKGVMTWRDKMLVIRHLDDSCTRCWAYILDLKRRAWKRLPLPEYFTPNRIVFGCGMDL
ncbi:hypothetical protein V2J09_005450 [Rumex salicifolius]